MTQIQCVGRDHAIGIKLTCLRRPSWASKREVAEEKISGSRFDLSDEERQG